MTTAAPISYKNKITAVTIHYFFIALHQQNLIDMKKFIAIFFLVFLGAIPCLFAQTPIFNIEISADTLGLTGSIEVSFTLENAQGSKFKAPDFEGFNVQGPSQSTSMSMINGVTTQSQTFIFFLTPKEKGDLIVKPASIVVNGEMLTTLEKKVVVLEEYEQSSSQGSAKRNNMQRQQFNIFGQPQNRAQPVEKAKPKKKYQTDDI
jgi:hypothetical protein